MRIVLDTNALVSATFWYGDSNEIIKLVENKKLELVLSKEILDEFSRVLNYEEIQEKVKNKNLEILNSFQKIVELAVITEPKVKLNIIKDDPDDNKILECAKSGKVDYIVTNDNHLLKLKAYEDLLILTPREFMRRIHQKKAGMQ